MTADTGRDLTSVGVQECSLFVLPKRELQKMKDNFRDVFNEMEDLAIKRYKNHKVLITKLLSSYINYIKYDTKYVNDNQNDDIIEEEEEDSESEVSNLNSQNSERVNLDYKKAILALEKTEQQNDLKNREDEPINIPTKEENIDSTNLSKD